jgi:hypothetical protein
MEQLPKADMHGCMNAAEPRDDVQGRTSVTEGKDAESDCPRAAGLNKISAGSTIKKPPHLSDMKALFL